MSAKNRQLLNVQAAPDKLNQFRQSIQGAFETCEAKAYAESIARDVRSRLCSLVIDPFSSIQTEGTTSRLVTDKHLARVLPRAQSSEPLPVRLQS